MNPQAWKITDASIVEGEPADTFITNSGGMYSRAENNETPKQKYLFTTAPAADHSVLNIDGANQTSIGIINGIPPIFP